MFRYGWYFKRASGLEKHHEKTCFLHICEKEDADRSAASPGAPSIVFAT